MRPLGRHYWTRKLYTDGETFDLDLRAVVVLNGISAEVTQPDLMRRCVILKFPFIPPNRRLTELEIGKRIRAIGPQVLGAMFSIVSKAMSLVPKYADLEEKSIMADFEMWGCAITEALGRDPNEFLRLYRDNQRLQNEEIISNDVLNTLLVQYIESQAELEKSPTFVRVKQTVLDMLTMSGKLLSPGIVSNKYWPRTTKSLSRRMDRLRPALREIGWEFTEKQEMKNGVRQQIVEFAKHVEVPLASTQFT